MAIKKLFIPLEYEFRDFKNPEKTEQNFLNSFKALKIPENIALVYSVQFRHLAGKIKNILEKNRISVEIFRQVLGCTSFNSFRNFRGIKAVILVSEGRFHAVSLAYETKLPVYLIDSELKIIKIPEKEIKFLEKKQKASYMKFLNSEKIGVIASLKPGQNRIKKAVDFIKKLEKRFKQKKFYLFLCTNAPLSEFENFSEIHLWINTACPRLDMDFLKSGINAVNMNSLNKFLKIN